MIRVQKFPHVLRLVLAGLAAASALALHAAATADSAAALPCELEGTQTVKACTDR